MILVCSLILMMVVDYFFQLLQLSVVSVVSVANVVMVVLDD